MPADWPQGARGGVARAAKADGSNLLKQGWTPEEDATIVRMVSLTGQKWSFIACALPGRTDDAVRNRYLRLQKRKSVGGTSAAAGLVMASSPTVTSADLADCQATKKGDMWTAEEDAKIMDGVGKRAPTQARRPSPPSPSGEASESTRV